MPEKGIPFDSTFAGNALKKQLRKVSKDLRQVQGELRTVLSDIDKGEQFLSDAPGVEQYYRDELKDHDCR
ncbi:MAG: hypothetical protein GY952_12545 [Rhodobacteraceae bacterium]|nr:hypothetical protein [Paracoccaceae bacterium]